MSRTQNIGWSGEYLELPGGIISSGGYFYNITSDGIEHIAPGLIQKVDLAVLIRQADTLAVIPVFAAFIGLLVGLTWGLITGLLLAIAAGIAAYVLRPFLSGPGFATLLPVIFSDAVALVAAAVVLAWLGYSGEMLRMFCGLAGFFVFRGLLLFGKDKQKADPPTRSDRILYFVIQKHALAHGLNTNTLEEIQNNIIYYLNQKKKRSRNTP